MKKNQTSIRKFLSAFLLGTVVIAGCKTPTTVDSGPIRARTFSFLRPRPQPEFAERRQPIHQLIQDAIAQNLAARGVKQVPDGGEVTAAYMLVVGNNATTSAINEYFGHTPDAAALSERAHAAYTGSAERNSFEAGTLIIDLVDPATHKVLFRGNVTRKILREAPLDARQSRIQEAVNAALAEVRVEH
jgi:hypothetical protein